MARGILSRIGRQARTRPTQGALMDAFERPAGKTIDGVTYGKTVTLTEADGSTATKTTTKSTETAKS